jgi:hypothetical protein
MLVHEEEMLHVAGRKEGRNQQMIIINNTKKLYSTNFTEEEKRGRDRKKERKKEGLRSWILSCLPCAVVLKKKSV